MLYDVLAALIAGSAIKFVDCVEDTLGGKNLWKWPVAIIAGLAGGYLLSFSILVTVFLPVIAAMVFMGKVNRPSLGLALMLAMVIVVLFGIPSLDISLFVPFFVLAVLDEMPWRGMLNPLREYRLWLKGGALVVSLTTGMWIYFVGLMAFDMAYIAVHHYIEEPKEKGAAKPKAKKATAAKATKPKVKAAKPKVKKAKRRRKK